MSNLQTITDGASESIEGLDGLLDSPESSSPRTATSPNLRRGRFTDVHNVSAAVPAPALLCRPT
jgi:hypothetical protein